MAGDVLKWLWKTDSLLILVTELATQADVLKKWRRINWSGFSITSLVSRNFAIK